MNKENKKSAKRIAQIFAGPDAAINGIYGDAMKVKNKGAETQISGICVITNKHHAVNVLTADWKKWAEDRTRSIEESFPELEQEDAEWLISGISPKGWEAFFGKK
tara:strand:- start:1720 stop:2034 length:315 start_codon:yes stop_codon:yes gene_type:complete